MRPSAAAILQLPIIRQRFGRLVAHRDSSSRRSTAQVHSCFVLACLDKSVCLGTVTIEVHIFIVGTADNYKKRH